MASKGRPTAGRRSSVFFLPHGNIEMNAQPKLLYTARVHTTGGREGGTSRSSDGNLDIRISPSGRPRHRHQPGAALRRRLVRLLRARSTSPHARAG